MEAGTTKRFEAINTHRDAATNSSPEMYSSEQRRSGAERILWWSSLIDPSCGLEAEATDLTEASRFGDFASEPN